MKSILTITNGTAFNKYFTNKNKIPALPFCEAMMDGETCEDIYSAEFVRLRSTSNAIAEDEYKSKARVFEVLKNSGKEYGMIRLYFGKDTFCQMNLLTLLAYLEQISFIGKITLNYIDDESFEIIEEGIDVKLGGYKKMYEKLLVDKQAVFDVGVLDTKALSLYFDYHSSDGFLARRVKENKDLDEFALLCDLLSVSKDYGLSDLQVKRFIDKHKKSEV